MIEENKDLLNEEEIEENEQMPTNDGMPPKKDNRKVLIPIIVAAIVVLCVLIFVLLQGGNKNPQPTPTPTTTTTPAPTETTETVDWSKDIELWDSNYQINEDYIGEIRFESGIIDLPVVQYADPNNIPLGYSKYLRTDWKTMQHDEEGSIFVDPFSNLEDSKNIVMYGHYVYASYDASGTHKFTPLVKFYDEANYEENKYIYLILKDEVRKYEVAHAYLAQLDSSGSYVIDPDMQYMKPDWTKEELETYLDAVSEVEFYDTGVEIGENDKMLTLQTCVEGRDDQREIVVCKEIEVTKIR